MNMGARDKNGKISAVKKNESTHVKPSSTSEPTNIPLPTFARSDAEAQQRFERYRTNDPFHEIEPALLNSADILAYVKTTALIYPFDPQNLCGASYDVKIEGDVIFYDESKEDGKKEQVITLDKDGACFDLRPNSIAFVTLQPIFRIPDYLALRFNLKISHIYKGLLLGTGPLVDPGFQGKLSIPLHNLTNNTYRFFKGDTLITMEFTKMSSNLLWNSSIPNKGHTEQYIRNNIMSNRTVSDYIAKALKKDRLSTVISSIPSAMQQSRQDAKDAKKAVIKIERRSLIQAGISVAAIAAIVISAISLAISAVNKANERYDELVSDYNEMKATYSQKIEDLSDLIDTLSSQIETSIEENSQNENNPSATSSQLHN